MRDPQLEASMRRLAAQVAAMETPQSVEAAVMAEFDRVHRRRPGRALAFCGALAASLLAGLLLLAPAPKHAAPVESQSFYPIPYTAPLEPYERVLVVQEQVPATELIAAGFHLPVAGADGMVRADVMVSQDGRPRAIRPVVFNGPDRSDQ
ncbi:MAG TPA: hypothetical protein VHW09_19230 [Bryobacteraceae bacterium]|jgi:hypothetical protein|nr:hypothetical protein [Bryobacteraceae bacterium]